MKLSYHADKIDDHLKAGIYGINCENCEARYLG